MAQVVKNPPAVLETQETPVWSLGREDPLEKEMTTHFSILAWKIPWTEQPGSYSPWGRRVRHGWSNGAQNNKCMKYYGEKGHGSIPIWQSEKVKVKVAQLCLTVWNPKDFTVHGILQVRILEWVAFLFFRGIFPRQRATPGLPHCRWILFFFSCIFIS